MKLKELLEANEPLKRLSEKRFASYIENARACKITQDGRTGNGVLCG